MLTIIYLFVNLKLQNSRFLKLQNLQNSRFLKQQNLQNSRFFSSLKFKKIYFFKNFFNNFKFNHLCTI